MNSALSPFSIGVGPRGLSCSSVGAPWPGLPSGSLLLMMLSVQVGRSSLHQARALAGKAWSLFSWVPE